MALIDRPETEHLKPQALAILQAFQRVGTQGLSTRELLNLTYLKADAEGKHTEHIGDWRARKSDLKKAGYLFRKEACDGGFRYYLEGKAVPDPELPGLALAGVGR